MAALDNVKLKDVLADVASGSLQLPDFQRNWKWDDDRIRAIIATVTLDYPLGVVMTLQTGGATRFRSRTLTGAQPDGDPAADLLLLDGQQRLTSLFQSLWLDAPVETADSRGKAIQRWYYVDIAKAVGPSADRDEAVVSVPADKVLRTDFNRTVVLDLSTTEAECAAGLFPLHFVFDAQRVNEWKRAYIKADEERNWDRWGQFDEAVLQQVRAFQVPMIRLAASTSMDAVCAVFERVNTGGVPLNVFELLTATYAGDGDYVERTGDYYQLPEVWREIKQALASKYPVFGRLDSGLENGLSSIDFLQAIALVRTWERKQSGIGTTVSCKRRDLLDLPLADFVRLAPKLADAFAWVGDFLERQSIVRPADLPYKTQLVPLAAVRAILGHGGGTGWGRRRRPSSVLVRGARGDVRRLHGDALHQGRRAARPLDLPGREGAGDGHGGVLLRRAPRHAHHPQQRRVQGDLRPADQAGGGGLAPHGRPAQSGPAGRVRRGRASDLPQDVVPAGQQRGPAHEFDREQDALVLSCGDGHDGGTVVVPVHDGRRVRHAARVVRRRPVYPSDRSGRVA